MQVTLPVFRIGGLGATASVATLNAVRAHLWQQFLLFERENGVMGFSSTLYCVHRDGESMGQIELLLGKLLSTDGVLPDGLNEVFVPPQVYEVLELPHQPTDEWLSQQWAHIHQQPWYRGNRLAFESYPKMGAMRIYVGIDAPVEISEE